MIVLISLFQSYHYTRIPVVLSSLFTCHLRLSIVPSLIESIRACFLEHLPKNGADILPPFVFCASNALSFPFSIPIPVHCNIYHTIRGFNMPTVLSFNFKKSALVIALVLVPLAILCCILAVALACSEYWSSRAPESRSSRLCGCSKRNRKRQRSHSDPSSSCTTEIPEVSAPPSEYCSPSLREKKSKVALWLAYFSFPSLLLESYSQPNTTRQWRK